MFRGAVVFMRTYQIRHVVLGKQMWPLAGTGCGLQHAASATARAHLPVRDKAGKKKAVARHTRLVLVVIAR